LPKTIIIPPFQAHEVAERDAPPGKRARWDDPLDAMSNEEMRAKLAEWEIYKELHGPLPQGIGASGKAVGDLFGDAAKAGGGSDVFSGNGARKSHAGGRKSGGNSSSRNISARPVEYDTELRTSERKIAEILENHEKITMKTMTGVLDEIGWPKSNRRFRSMLHCFSLGIVNNYAKGMSCSRYTTEKHKNFCKLVNRFFADTAPPEWEQRGYSAIELTKNMVTPMHQDKNNHGDSYAISLGNFNAGTHGQYGALWVSDSY
jgi:hypothetical protein